MRLSSLLPWSASRLRSVFFMLAGSALVAGCEESAPARTVPRIVAETPEAKLEVAMERLRSAMIDAAAAQGSGVVSQRKSSYRLIPPVEEHGQYKAEVTIQTVVALAHAPAAATLPPRKEDDEPATWEEDEAALEEEEFKVDERPDEADEADEADVANDEEQEIDDNGVTRKAIAQSRETKTDVYDLVYEDDRWKLATKLDPKDDEVAKYLFKFALNE
jgi:hypothetical protein